MCHPSYSHDRVCSNSRPCSSNTMVFASQFFPYIRTELKVSITATVAPYPDGALALNLALHVSPLSASDIRGRVCIRKKTDSFA